MSGGSLPGVGCRAVVGVGEGGVQAGVSLVSFGTVGWESFEELPVAGGGRGWW
ncbi:hypothetical protein [Streptomyces longisporoflavus]|uniref:Uncharacterized protein n=1 Tax=Streptomyces longisporoflavus TaxID=28044 RepID=A0ABW7QNN2_9ACTN